MSKIPKEIVDKIEKRNKLNEEIDVWRKENLDMDGMCLGCADITDYHTGKEQGNAFDTPEILGNEAVKDKVYHDFMKKGKE